MKTSSLLQQIGEFTRCDKALTFDAGITLIRIISPDESPLIECERYLPLARSTEESNWNIFFALNDELRFGDLLNCTTEANPITLKPHPNTTLSAQFNPDPNGVSIVRALDGSFDILVVGKNLFVTSREVEARQNRPLLYAIREIVLHENDRIGGMMLHASCISILDNGLIFIGNKGSGKTTTALSGLMFSDSHFISNDRTVVSIDSRNRILCSTFPIPLRIGKNMLSLFENLAVFSKREEHFHTGDSGVKVEVLPSELVEAFSRSLIGSSQLSCLIFPKYLPNQNRGYVAALEPKDTMRNLEMHCLNGRDPAWKYSWLTKLRNAHLPTNDDILFNRVASLPAYELVSSSTYQTAKLINSILNVI